MSTFTQCSAGEDIVFTRLFRFHRYDSLQRSHYLRRVAWLCARAPIQAKPPRSEGYDQSRNSLLSNHNLLSLTCI